MSLYFTKQNVSTYMYAFSGFSDHVLNSVECMSFETMKWRELGGKL